VARAMQLGRLPSISALIKGSQASQDVAA
jgi:hypothetical protein